MRCPLCGVQKAKRSCPALQQAICPVCCGTKRQVSIRCPDDCSYLAGARLNPPAVVARQRERDFEFALPLLEKLPDRAMELFFVFAQTIRRSSRAALPSLIDRDVVEACQAFASTLETAARGIIYDHQATSIPAQRLVKDLSTTLEELATSGEASGLERDAALALRRLGEGAGGAMRVFGGDERDFMAFLDRLPGDLETKDARTPSGDGSTQLGAAQRDEPRIILP
ncbi:MAG: hypothetical protein AB7I50_14765 [Vicinamibacterales bacterium]